MPMLGLCIFSNKFYTLKVMTKILNVGCENLITELNSDFEDIKRTYWYSDRLIPFYYIIIGNTSDFHCCLNDFFVFI